MAKMQCVLFPDYPKLSDRVKDEEVRGETGDHRGRDHGEHGHGGDNDGGRGSEQQCSLQCCRDQMCGVTSGSLLTHLNLNLNWYACNV